MWSDNDTRRDFLNFRCVADTAAELIIQASGTPLSMGISGGWGVGKSSMLNLIKDALEQRSEADKSYIFVEFNAWLYQGYDDARAALMEKIAKHLIHHARENASALEKATVLAKRVNWLRVGGLTAVSAVAMALGLPPIGLLGAIQGVTDEDAAKEDVETLEKERKRLANAGIVNPKKEKTPPSQIDALREGFRDALNEMNVTLIVLIDDLDRCLPSTAISTLEAVRLFLFLPRTAFIIAADDKMIRHAVRAHFKNVELNDDLVTNYFDKLIQIPLRVPPLGTQEVRAYLMLLYIDKANYTQNDKEAIRTKVCERLSESWKGKRVDRNFIQGILYACSDELRRNIALSDRLAPLLTSAKQVAGNPRLIKRFLNTLWIRLAVARSQGVTVDESTLAKVLLFERCASEASYRHLANEVNNSDSGKPGFLKEPEQQARSGEEVTSLPVEWNTSFVLNWLALDPPLADADLRAVMYVSRETLPIITASDQMSTDARGILEALVSLSGVDKTLQPKIQALSGREHHLIVERLLVRARQEQEWGKSSLVFAFVVMIDAVPSLAPGVVQFFLDIDASQLKAPIVPLLSDKTWASEILRTWEAAQNVPAVVRKAIRHFDRRRG